MQQKIKKSFMFGFEYAKEHIITEPNFTIYIGALVSHIIVGYKKSFKGTAPFLKTIFTKRTEKFFIIFDLIVLPLLAVYIGNIIVNPTTPIAELYTGLTWTTTLMAFTKSGGK